MNVTESRKQKKQRYKKIIEQYTSRELLNARKSVSILQLQCIALLSLFRARTDVVFALKSY